MSTTRISELLIKAVSGTLTSDERAELIRWKNELPENQILYERIMDPGKFLGDLRKRESKPSALNQPILYPAPINEKDPYQWPHTHDRQWFLKQIFNLIHNSPDINSIQVIYCFDASIQHILIHHNYLLATNGDFFTFNFVLDVLSAAYCVPLLPDMPTEEAKEIANGILNI
jgi:hypothetical protein